MWNYDPYEFLGYNEGQNWKSESSLGNTLTSVLVLEYFMEV